MTNPLEAAERRRRDLASAARRLRVAVMTDPGRAGELADTLVELVGNRLLAWSFAEAAADAPDSVVLSARILAERGPIGPYASAEDAVRYFTASAQLAAVQAGLGQLEAAGRTLDALDGWRSQLGRLPLVENLTPAAVAWALVTRARASAGAEAHAYAEAALLRLYATGLERDPGLGSLVITCHLAVAGAHWSQGRDEAALAHHRLALSRYRTLIAGLTGTQRPAVAQVALAPLPEVFGGLALRLEASGDRATAIAVRREWLTLAERFGEADGPAAEAARLALAEALFRAGRKGEAEALVPGIDPEPGLRDSRSARPQPPDDPIPRPTIPAAGRRPLRPGFLLGGSEQAHPAHSSSPSDGSPLPTEQALGTDRLSVTVSLRLRQDERTAIAEGPAARSAAETEEGRLQAGAEQAAAVRAAERAAAERQAAAEAAAAEREAAEQARLAALAEAERREALASAERAAAEERRRERAAAHRAARTVDPEELRAALAALPDARQAVAEAESEPAERAARERLAALLRPVAVAEPDRHRDELLATLEALVGLRWRLGDPDGSREIARELKSW